jgi:hypothetical protein
MRLLIAGAMCGLIAAPACADDENPFKKAKVGDWTEYKMTTGATGANFTAKMKMIATAKNDKEVTVTTTGSASLNGKDLPPAPEQQTKIDLGKPYDGALAAANLPKGADAKFTKESTGEEKLKVGDKEYGCVWTKGKITGKINGQDHESTIKLWTCKDVPLSGLVKMEMKSKFATMTLELTGSGSK